MTDIRPINAHYAVGPQLDPATLSDLAAAGFTIVICNRPDNEDPGQPSMAQMSAAAKAAGLAFEAIPITAPGVSQEDVQKMLALMATHDKGFAYCRSGTRSALLHSLARATAGEPIDQILTETAAAGYDFTTQREQLTALQS